MADNRLFSKFSDRMYYSRVPTLQQLASCAYYPEKKRLPEGMLTCHGWSNCWAEAMNYIDPNHNRPPRFRPVAAVVVFSLSPPEKVWLSKPPRYNPHYCRLAYIDDNQIANKDASYALIYLLNTGDNHYAWCCDYRSPPDYTDAISNITRTLANNLDSQDRLTEDTFVPMAGLPSTLFVALPFQIAYHQQKRPSVQGKLLAMAINELEDHAHHDDTESL